jgi:hypothetical protein
VCTYCGFDKLKVEFETQPHVHTRRVWVCTSGHNILPLSLFEFEPQPHVHTRRMWVWMSGHDILPLSLFKCCRGIRASQNFSSLTKFVENINNIVFNIFIMKIDSMIYLIILIMYYKY